MEFFRRLAEILQIEGATVLATVVQTKGSVPREVGAKMIICADGRIFGTIGGGAGEAKIIREAKNVLQTGAKQSVEIDLTNLEAEGICGGKMQIRLERWRGERSLALVNQILESLEEGKSIRLATLPESGKTPFLLNENEIAPPNAFVEILEPEPVLLIVGAGHIGIELAKIAESIGFRVAVQDNRQEWANAENYPNAKRIFTETIEETVAQFAKHKNLYAALLTRGFEYDLEALKAILSLENSCVYVGMIGSEKRVRQVFRAIEQCGFSKDKLSKVYAPVGLDIGALTPSEIAVSIAAELIMARRGGTGKSLSIGCK